MYVAHALGHMTRRCNRIFHETDEPSAQILCHLNSDPDQDTAVRLEDLIAQHYRMPGRNQLEYTKTHVVKAQNSCLNLLTKQKSYQQICI